MVQAGALFIALVFVLVNLLVDFVLRAARPADQAGMSGAVEIAAPVRRPPGVLRALRRTPARIGLAITLVFLVLTVAAGWLAPYDPYDQDLSAALSPAVGRPLVAAPTSTGATCSSRVMHGTRTALLAVVVADGLALALGCAIGLVAGFFGGRVDALVMRLVDVHAGVSVSAAGADHRGGAGAGLTNSMIAIGIVYTPQYARLLRGQVLAVQNADFVLRHARSVAAAAAHHAAPRAAEQLCRRSW